MLTGIQARLTPSRPCHGLQLRQHVAGRPLLPPRPWGATRWGGCSWRRPLVLAFRESGSGAARVGDTQQQATTARSNNIIPLPSLGEPDPPSWPSEAARKSLYSSALVDRVSRPLLGCDGATCVYLAADQLTRGCCCSHCQPQGTDQHSEGVNEASAGPLALPMTCNDMTRPLQVTSRLLATLPG